MFRSLVVVSKTHADPHQRKMRTICKGNKDFCKLNGNSNYEKWLEKKAKLVYNKPLIYPNGFCVVLWNSAVANCNGTNSGKGYAPRITHKGHFRLQDDFMRFLNKYGWAVVELPGTDMPVGMPCIKESVQLVNKEQVHNITEHNLPPLKSKGLRGFYGLAHTPWADAMRLYAKPVWQKIYGTDDLTCSLDSPAIDISVKGYKNQNWMHVDKHPDTKGTLIQGTICAPPVGPSPWARKGQHVCWAPRAQQQTGAKQRFEDMRRCGHSSTHDPRIGRINWKAVPTFRPPPKKHLQVHLGNMETLKLLI